MDIALQTYCIHCLKEQYAPYVSGISKGLGACAWCCEKSYVMDEDEYLLQHTFAWYMERKNQTSCQQGES